ncbi:MAG: substrate-binding domain-containing protein [Candidatus Methanomethylophilaceae archaeon]
MNKKIIVIGIVAIIAIAAVGMFMMNRDDSGSDVKAISLNGVEATEDNVSNGTYPIQRNLVLCTMGEPTGNVKCFIDWITSDEGQAIVAEEFVPLPAESRTTFTAPVSSDDIVVGGSTSIQATMTKLAAAYKEKYGINVSVTGGGSGVGASSTISGQFNIGMCSRDLKSSELSAGLVPVEIGKDGVAVIVNGAGVTNLTIEQISKIYSGEITNWKEVGGVDKEIAVIARDDSSGTRECFDNAMGSGWAMKSDVVKYNSTGGVIGAVKNTAGSIGYISIGQLSAI